MRFLFSTLNYYIWIFFGLIGAGMYYSATFMERIKERRRREREIEQRLREDAIREQRLREDAIRSQAKKRGFKLPESSEA